MPATARQVVRVDASGTYATVDLLQQLDGTWQCTRRDMTGRVGKTGVRALAQRVSGDGTTPAGTFPLGTMTAPDGQTFQFFGNGANPGVQGQWRQVQPGDCWDATGGDATYNTLTQRSAARAPATTSTSRRSSTPTRGAALIGANMGPDRSGDQPGETPRAAGDLPAPLQLRRQRQQQADVGLRQPRRRRPRRRPAHPGPRPGLVRHHLLTHRASMRRVAS